MVKFENFLLTFCVPLTLPVRLSVRLSSRRSLTTKPSPLGGEGGGEGKFQIFLVRIYLACLPCLPQAGAGRDLEIGIFTL